MPIRSRLSVTTLSSLQIYQWVSVILLCCLVCVVWVVYQDFGIVWDEPNHQYYGQRIIDYYAGFLDPSVFPIPDGELTNEVNYLLYGGLFDTIVAVSIRLFGGDEYETRHLVTALIGIAGIIGTWKLANLLAGNRAALLSAVLLCVAPSYFGHMFNNPKDIPFAVGYVWSVYYLLRSFSHFPNIPNGLLVKLGLAIGCMAGVRVPGFIIGFGYFCLAALVYGVFPACISKISGHTLRPSRWVPSLIGAGVKIFLVAYLLMLLCWPWAQINPLFHPYTAFRLFSSFSHFDGYILFGGTYIRSIDIPIHYIPQYFLVKMPEIIIVCLGLGFILTIHAVIHRRISMVANETGRYAFLICAAFFPISYAIVSRSVIYDSIRHFLFIVPILCVISGVTLHRFTHLLEQERRWMASGFLVVLGLVLLQQISINIQLHPNQYVYYNRFAGGLTGANGRYEMDYWGNSYKEAVELLAAYVHRTEPQISSDTRYRVYVCGPFLSASYYFPYNFTITHNAEDADFFISFTRVDCHQSVPGIQIAAVTRMGVTLSVVKDLRN